MTFLWPAALVLTLTVPGFLAFYIVHEKRKRETQHRAALYAAVPGVLRRRPLARHLPLALFLVSLAALAIAAARPQALITLFSVKGTIVLAVDVSISMKAEDAAPSRILRAQTVARDFVERHADDFRIGLVAFGATAASMLDPTTDREQLFAAIDQLAMQRGTAIGTGIAAALNMILPEAGIDTTTLAIGRTAPDGSARSSTPAHEPAATSTAGAQGPVAIVLVSDGQSTTGPDPVEAARLAARYGVRIHTLGVGSTEGMRMQMDGWSMRVRLDRAALEEISALTQGKYLGTTTPVDWQEVSRSIRSEFRMDDTHTEITALFAAAGAIAAVAAALLSLYHTKRVL
jgi:Ca-activated chloride channel family protein